MKMILMPSLCRSGPSPVETAPGPDVLSPAPEDVPGEWTSFDAKSWCNDDYYAIITQ